MSKEPKGIIITERPAFMIVVDKIEQPFKDGYTLLVDVDKMQASIINLTKGGKDSMVKQEVVALEGYEAIVESLYEKKAKIQDEKAEAIEKAKAEVEERFAINEERVNNAINELTKVIEIEVPDEVEAETVGIDAENIGPEVSEGTISLE